MNNFKNTNLILIIPISILVLCLLCVANLIHRDSVKNNFNPWIYSILSIIFFPATLGILIYLKVRKCELKNYKTKLIFSFNIFLGVISTILITLFLTNITPNFPVYIQKRINITLIFISPVILISNLVLFFKFLNNSIRIKDMFIKRIYLNIFVINLIPMITTTLIFNYFGY